MKSDESFHHFVYEAENFVSELVIAFSSFAAILVTVYSVFGASGGVGFLTLGRNIFPWLSITALFVIARELWIMNYDRRHRSMSSPQEDSSSEG